MTAPQLDGNVVSVDSTSSTDVWAVGENDQFSTPLILHWDGNAWTESPQDASLGFTGSVDAISPTDAWVAGSYGGGPVVKHWDGAIWTSVPIPKVANNDALTAVSAVSSIDVWVVGQYTDANGLHPLTEHWDGSSWTWVPAPDGVLNSTNFLMAVSAIATDDVWAVGYEDDSFLNFKPLIEHWDGSAWSVSPSPVLSGNENIMYGVSASSSNEVWAVGIQGDSGTELRTLAERWDGSSWSVVFTPNVQGTLDTFQGVDAVSASDAWAVGHKEPQHDEVTLAEHWNGTRWTIVKTPTTGGASFGGVHEVTPTTIWAVGGVANGSNINPLTMRAKGCQA